MLIIIIVIIILYLFLIGSLVIGFDKVTHFNLEDLPAQTKFSIIIPFRNEAENLPQLLASILKLNYPTEAFEIIFVNDASEDQSVEIIDNTLSNRFILYSILKNNIVSNSPKKDAITTAMQHAKFDWILTTDADCRLPKYWLDAFDCYIQKNKVKLIVAPVTYYATDSFFKRFQLLDFLSLQGATVGGFGINKPFLCSGANLAYKKEFFIALHGFEGNDHISSGDDVFLLQKAIKATPNEIKYLKNDAAIVTTSPQLNFKNLISQRVRWAAKTTNYNSSFGKFTGIVVLLMNALMVCLPVLVLAQITTLNMLIYSYTIKFCIDFLLLFKTTRFFNQESYLASYVFAGFIYPFFNVYVASVSVFKGYKWKGRAYTK